MQGSPLRRYIAQIAASGFGRHEQLLEPEPYTKDLLFDMSNFILRTGLQENWVGFSEQELEQFFVEEVEAEESGEKGKVNDEVKTLSPSVRLSRPMRFESTAQMEHPSFVDI